MTGHYLLDNGQFREGVDTGADGDCLISNSVYRLFHLAGYVPPEGRDLAILTRLLRWRFAMYLRENLDANVDLPYAATIQDAIESAIRNHEFDPIYGEADRVDPQSVDEWIERRVATPGVNIGDFALHLFSIFLRAVYVVGLEVYVPGDASPRLLTRSQEAFPGLPIIRVVFTRTDDPFEERSDAGHYELLREFQSSANAAQPSVVAARPSANAARPSAATARPSVAAAPSSGVLQLQPLLLVSSADRSALARDASSAQPAPAAASSPDESYDYAVASWNENAQTPFGRAEIRPILNTSQKMIDDNDGWMPSKGWHKVAEKFIPEEYKKDKDAARDKVRKQFGNFELIDGVWYRKKTTAYLCKHKGCRRHRVRANPGLCQRHETLAKKSKKGKAMRKKSKKGKAMRKKSKYEEDSDDNESIEEPGSESDDSEWDEDDLPSAKKGRY